MKKAKSSRQRYLLFLAKVVALFAMIFSLVAVRPVSAQGNADGGAIWYVSTTGDDANTCATTDAPCLTINGAISKAADGDTIQVAVGTYTGTGTEVVLINKSIILYGGWDGAFTMQSGVSTINGQSTLNGINISGSTLIVNLRQFIVRNSAFGVIQNNSGGTTSFNRFAIINNSRNGFRNGSGNANFSNATISGNHSVGTAGSAISNVSGNINIQYSTITNNAGTYDYAVYSANGFAQIEIGNSILAGNSYRDCYANMTSKGYNIFGSSPPCANPITLHPSDQIGVNPLIGVLQAEGYHPQLSGSPTINTANLETCPVTDQRGITRPQGSNCDVGSYELDAPLVMSIGRLDLNPTSAPNVNYLVTFSETVTGVDSSDFTLATSGTTGAFVASISGSGDVYTVTVNTGAGNGNGTLRLDVVDDDSILNSSSTPLGGTGTGNGDFTAGEIYSLLRVPTPKSPGNKIWDATPTFQWNRIAAATKYQYQLWKSTTLVYTKNVTSIACTATNCSSTPITLLHAGNYRWRVRAMIDGTWKDFSPYKSFSRIVPKPGFWSWSDNSPSFYVLKSKAVVADFSILVRHPTCGIRRITHINDATINGKNFKLTGSFRVNGTFINTTKVSGTLSLYNYYLPGCGYGSGGPYPWTAIWKNGSQPTLTLNEGDIPELTVSPEFSTPFEILTVDPEK